MLPRYNHRKLVSSQHLFAASWPPAAFPSSKLDGRATSFPGCDLALAPTAAQAQAWWDASPYYWMGYYLGGCCATASWVGAIDYPTLAGQGWGLRPLYVGQQTCGPCLGCACRPLLHPTAQGRGDADDAATRARQVGFPPSATLYLDVEQITGYTMGQAMLEYVNEWLYWLSAEHGFGAGVYTSGAQAARIQSIGIHPPFWIACYPGGSGYASPAACPCFPAPAVWQWGGGRPETWGGVTLTVDVDVAEGTGAGGAQPAP